MKTAKSLLFLSFYFLCIGQAANLLNEEMPESEQLILKGMLHTHQAP